MPKSADVEDFAAKLALLTKRLNWSRAKLAQEVGVDKSLAARWLNGNSRPTGNSLMQLTTAAARSVDGFTAADWDLTPEQFARRLGIEPAAVPILSGAPAASRLMLSGLRNPPPAATWGTAYVGLWAGFYQSLTNRGVVRLCAAEFSIDDASLRFAITDGFFWLEGSAIATHTHIHAICEFTPLDNHLAFFAFGAAQDMQGVAVIDGLMSAIGPDDTAVASPMLLFRINDETHDRIVLRTILPRVAEANNRIESEAARTGNPLAATCQIASADILRVLCPIVGTVRTDGAIDHVLRIPPKRSLATGTAAMSSLPADAPLRVVPANLRRVLGLDAFDTVHLAGSFKR
jgi:hypothetical protein